MDDNNLIICYDETGEWQGIYVNNELFVEDHNLYIKHWIKLIKEYSLFSRDIREYVIVNGYIENLGNFPRKFTEIPKKYALEV